jgi:hypothetical protein
MKHLRPADHRETNGRILAAILNNQNSLGCRLKPADDRILAGVSDSNGAFGPGSCGPAQAARAKSQWDYGTSHVGHDTWEH